MREATKEFIHPEELWKALIQDQAHIIDVRAAIEFSAGHIPCSENLPILNDAERALVGTTYKKEGPAAAVTLGHQIVQGAVKEERLSSWIESIQKHRGISYLTCFRGGQRSGITQKWLREKGVSVPRLKGGYKEMRRLMMESLASSSKSQKLIVVTGKTGAGKTTFLKTLPPRQTVDLEDLARHRGSAFGAFTAPQPSQSDYENRLSLSLARQMSATPLVVEDESRMIGRIAQPADFFTALRSSPVLFLDEPLHVRIENTLQEYVIAPSQDPDLFLRLRKSLNNIKDKLGDVRYRDISNDMETSKQAVQAHGDFASCRGWIEKLLTWYYDPVYERSLQKRDPHILVRGTKTDLLDFVTQNFSAKCQDKIPSF